MASKPPPAGKRTRHSKFKAYIPRAIEIRKTMDLGWRETAEMLGKEVGLKIPHNSLFKAATAWLFRQTELEKWPDIDAAAKVNGPPNGTAKTPPEDWPEDPAQPVNLPEVKIRKPRQS